MVIISRVSLWPASLLALYVGRRRPLSYALGITFLRLVRPAPNGPLRPNPPSTRRQIWRRPKTLTATNSGTLMPNSKTRFNHFSFKNGPSCIHGALAELPKRLLAGNFQTLCKTLYRNSNWVKSKEVVCWDWVGILDCSLEDRGEPTKFLKTIKEWRVSKHWRQGDDHHVADCWPNLGPTLIHSSAHTTVNQCLNYNLTFIHCSFWVIQYYILFRERPSEGTFYNILFSA